MCSSGHTRRGCELLIDITDTSWFAASGSIFVRQYPRELISFASV